MDYQPQQTCAAESVEILTISVLSFCECYHLSPLDGTFNSIDGADSNHSKLPSRALRRAAACAICRRPLLSAVQRVDQPKTGAAMCGCGVAVQKAAVETANTKNVG